MTIHHRLLSQEMLSAGLSPQTVALIREHSQAQLASTVTAAKMLAGQETPDGSSRSSVSVASQTTPLYSPSLIKEELGNMLLVEGLNLDKEQTQTAYFELGSGSTSDNDEGELDSEDFQIGQLTQANDSQKDLPGTQPLLSCTTSTNCCAGLDQTNNKTDQYSTRYKVAEHLSDDHTPPFDDMAWDFKTKWAIVLIGLPASGKSSVIADLMDFVQVQTKQQLRMKSFNAGDVRRNYQENGFAAKFDFNFDNSDSLKLRDLYAFEALRELTNGLIDDQIDVGIFDATNTTRQRRHDVFEKIKIASKTSGVEIKPILFEVKCQNRALRRFNIEQKSLNKDYKNMPKEAAIIDFLARVKTYETQYQAVTVEEINQLHVKYFGINNVGEDIYYDCGLKHHNSNRHKRLRFGHITLNLIYEFLMAYRTLYAVDYLKDVCVFYTEGHYKPVCTTIANPVTHDEYQKLNSAVSEGEQTSKDTENTTIPKVLSACRTPMMENM